MSLTKRQLAVLRQMEDARASGDYADAELVRDSGLFYWLDTDQIHHRTVDALLNHVAISSDADGSGCQRYVINSTGQAILRRPALADEVREALLRDWKFTIKDDRVAQLVDGRMP